MVPSSRRRPAARGRAPPWLARGVACRGIARGGRHLDGPVRLLDYIVHKITALAGPAGGTRARSCVSVFRENRGHTPARQSASSERAALPQGEDSLTNGLIGPCRLWLRRPDRLEPGLARL